jgi:hypothetical protein
VPNTEIYGYVLDGWESHCCYNVGHEPAEEEVDIGGDEPPFSRYPPVVIEKETNQRNNKCETSSSSSDTSASTSHGLFSPPFFFCFQQPLPRFSKTREREREREHSALPGRMKTIGAACTPVHFLWLFTGIFGGFLPFDLNCPLHNFDFFFVLVLI